MSTHRTDWHVRDDDLAAYESGVPLPATDLAQNLFTSAQSSGHGRAGTQALFTVLERLAKGK